MPYAGKTWADGPGGGTPVTAAELQRMETNAASAAADLDGKQPRGVPSGVGVRAGGYDPARSIYGATSANMRVLRAQLGKALAGTGLCRIGFCGDSLTGGVGATVGVNEGVTRLGQHFAGLGYTVGELVWISNGSTVDSRMTLGTWAAVPGNGWLSTVTGTGPLTYTSSASGTVVEILSRGDSPSFTYSIDGAAAVTVAAGAAAMRLTTITGLADSTHTVTLVGSGALIAAIGVRSTSGVVLMNAGQSGTVTGSWLPTANYYDGINNLLGAAPNVVLTELGRNDEFNTNPVASLQFNLNSIVTAVVGAGAAPFLAGSHPVTGPYMTAIYNVADTHSAPLLDLADRLTSAAPGLLSDGLHFNPSGHAAKAAAWADLFSVRTAKSAGGGALDPDLVTIAGLTATTDGILQAKASAWSVRTPAQVKADMTPAGSTNTAFGHQVLQANTTGNSNLGAGYQSLFGNTTGVALVAIGYQALVGNTTGNNNVGIGYLAGNANTAGSGNTAVGVQAMQSNASNFSTAIGYQAMQSNTTGSGNLAVGWVAMQGTTTGSNNTGVGTAAVAGNTTGNSNTGFGYDGLRSITTGGNNTAIGTQAGYTDGTTATVATVATSTMIGFQAQALVSNVCVIGSRIAAQRQSLCLGNYGELGGGQGVFSLSNAVTVPTTNPVGGGVMYAEAGALKWRGSAGTITTLAVA